MFFFSRSICAAADNSERGTGLPSVPSVSLCGGSAEAEKRSAEAAGPVCGKAEGKSGALKDSADLLRAAYANKLVGERFDFGRYPQGPNGEVKPITWRVLRCEKDGLLVISEYGLDAGTYNEKRVSITWPACTLRRWLNGVFFRKAFSSQEQSLIKVSRLSNKASRTTEDRIFLLSADESERLFADNNDRAAEPSAYAVKNGAYVRGGYAWQWLRSRGRSGGCAAYVGADGSVHSFDGRDVALGSGCVRPALRIIY